MLFSKLSRRSSFTIAILSCLVLLAMMVYNLGFSVSELAKQLIYIGIMILVLIASAFGTAVFIRYIVTLRDKE